MRSSSPLGQMKKHGKTKEQPKSQTSGSVTKNDTHTPKETKREENNRKGTEQTDDTEDQRDPHGWVHPTKSNTRHPQ